MNGKTYKSSTDCHPETIIISCSACRQFIDAYSLFIQGELHLARKDFIHISVTGGVQTLARKNIKSTDYYSLTGQIDFLTKHFHKIKKIILLGHQNCQYHSDPTSHFSKTQSEEDGIKIASAAIYSLLALLGKTDVTVFSYFAKLNNGDSEEITFELIDSLAILP